MTNDANAALIDSWQLHLHDKAASTREQYRKNVEVFARWLDGDLLDVDRRTFDKYLTEQKAAGRAQNTVRTRWLALRSFYRWAYEEEETDSFLMERVKVSKADAPPPDVLTLDEIRALLAAAKGKGFYDRRDAALIRVFLATGIRKSECANLQLADVDLKVRRAEIMGKGSRPRIVRFDPATAASIDRYLRTRARHRSAGLPWLWLGLKGRLTAHGVDDALRARSVAAGVTGFHLHRLRHSWADAWLSAGGQEQDMAQLGGWSSREVMARYGSAQATERALRNYDEVAPWDGI